jgi:hypothetical protein
MANYQTAASKKSAAVADLLCPTCKTAMHLSRTVPLANGCEQRSFFCGQCERWDNFILSDAFSSRLHVGRSD